MGGLLWLLCVVVLGWRCMSAKGDVLQVPLPNFADLRLHYPGYAHYGGHFHNHHLISIIGLSAADSSMLLHDTSALRLSYTLNHIGGQHSLGYQLIKLSKYGHDSLSGRNGLQYIFHPIAYGPFLADKYGYPSVSRLHERDPISAKKNFWGRQGILQVITYSRKKNLPKGHVGLWDCNHFHQSKDWTAGHSLITVEFWESPDSNCTAMSTEPHFQMASLVQVTSDSTGKDMEPELSMMLEASQPHVRLRHRHWEKRFLRKHHLGNS
ncbi:uncharacterized protein LOC112564377 isoform X1 [Pomacea canaliculata]|uniref:uncharacterized protein LOC112564377 isoform X1 n=1 Tax=Pomacea canaliculata TaxID=400727 RepID=UPI000D7379BB|nr:uncharacterized protein LOC112564377 isoform X1 [Pomacea canaliculata]